MDILDNEKQQYKKKDQVSREIIQELSRKLKVSMPIIVEIFTHYS